MPRGSTPKQERQYKHIESSERKRGASPGRAKEIAARTVNKQRAQSGQTSSGGSGSSGSTKSSGSKRSTSSSGSSSARGGTTFRELYAEAQRRDIKGRSSMDKAQLERALARSGGKRSK
jgi:hypothetical protein